MLGRLRGFIGRGSATDGKATYLGLRSMAFTLDPDALTFRPDAHIHGPWCSVIDLGLEAGTATLVAIGDGTVSLYASRGTGILGAGGHDAVWDAATRFLEASSGAVPFMRATDEVPATPKAGQVRLSVRTFDGTVSEEVAEETLQRGRHVLSPLYAAGQDLLTEVRLTGEPSSR